LRHNDAVPELIRPDQRVRVSFLAAMTEFRAEGRGGFADGSLEGDFLRAYPEHPDEAGFAAYVAWLRHEDGDVRTTLWYVDGETYIGRVSLRHRLTPPERERGGHIGYNVRPSARRRGHATAMLRSALRFAEAQGIEEALLTCDATNEASRRVIENCGGVLQDRRGDVLRYLVATGWMHR
jgi:predicted acetyltransferase